MLRYNEHAEKNTEGLHSYLAIIDVEKTSSRKDPAVEMTPFIHDRMRKYEQMKIFSMNDGRRLVVPLLCDLEAYDKIIGGAVEEYAEINTDQYRVRGADEDPDKRNPADIRFAVVTHREAEQVLRKPRNTRLRYVNTDNENEVEAAKLWPKRDPLNPSDIVKQTYALGVRWRWMQNIIGAMTVLGETLKQNQELKSWDGLRGEWEYSYMEPHIREVISVLDLRGLQLAPEGEERRHAAEDLFERVIQAELRTVSRAKGLDKRFDGRAYDTLALGYITLNNEPGAPVSPIEPSKPIYPTKPKLVET